MTNLLPDALERAIPGHTDGPLLPDAHARLATGRRSVRRRRLAAGRLVAAVAAAAVVVPSVLVNGAAPERQVSQVADGGVQITRTPAPSVSPRPESTDLPGAFRRSPVPLAHFDDTTQELELIRGATIVSELDDPFARTGAKGWAATVTYRGTTYWALAQRQGSTAASTDTEPIPGTTIEQWARDVEEANLGVRAPWVELAADGALTPLEGVTIDSQTSPAPVDQADPSRASANAILTVDGVARLCLIIRRDADGRTDKLPLPEAEYPGCTDLPGWDYPGSPVS